MRGVAALAGVVLVLAGCGGGSGSDTAQTESRPANPQAKAACAAPPLASKPKLPSRFPSVDRVTYTKDALLGPTEVVEGYFEGDVQAAHDAYHQALQDAGFAITFNEVEAPNDAEVSWKGQGRSGQVALRNDCGGGKTYVHITNRPA